MQQSGLDQLALLYQQKEQPATSKETLGKVKQKVLVICGDQDTDNGSATELAALIPKAQFKAVPGNHNNTTSSKEFSKEVLAFIKK